MVSKIDQINRNDEITYINVLECVEVSRFNTEPEVQQTHEGNVVDKERHF